MGLFLKGSWIYTLLTACLAIVANSGSNASIKLTEKLESEFLVERNVVVIDEIESVVSGLSTVVIDYGTVEEFGITVRLFPENRMTDKTCQALIELEHEGAHRVFLHNAFRDPNHADTLACGTVLKRKYQLPEGADDRHLSFEIFSQMPFFFLDVDFDGEKELVLTLTNQGQRWIDAYQPIHLGYDYLYDNLKEKPFTDLDALSKIDYDKNSITLCAYEGAGSWYDDVYVYQKHDGNMLFTPRLISHTSTEYVTWNKNETRKRIITERRDTTEWMFAEELLEKR